LQDLGIMLLSNPENKRSKLFLNRILFN